MAEVVLQLTVFFAGFVVFLANPGLMAARQESRAMPHRQQPARYRRRRRRRQSLPLQR